MARKAERDGHTSLRALSPLSKSKVFFGLNDLFCDEFDASVSGRSSSPPSAAGCTRRVTIDMHMRRLRADARKKH
jgi:hypothetical protein